VNKKFLAIIPARKGSIRLPNKNNRKIGNFSLVELAIKAAKKSKLIDEIIVSSNDQKVFKTANKFSDIKVIKRPFKLSNSKAKLVDVCNHVLKKINKEFEYLVLLQPTSPFRKQYHIDKAIKKVLKKSAEGLISASPTNIIYKNYYVVKNGFLCKTFDKKSPNTKKIQLNGAIYIIKTKLLIKRRSFFIRGKILPLLMPRKLSLDIDYLTDLNKARYSRL
tara:strand:+ start:343 stop:1002 length:660 start_codon:yes stop_codon:yes gene_type:complete